MEPMSYEIRLEKRAYWLIGLRWWAFAGVFLAVFFGSTILGVSLECLQLYVLGVVLGLHNLFALLMLKQYTCKGKEESYSFVKQIINYQMATDLVILTALLHFSGGITNPFVIYFIFHVILSSILLPVKESYFHATLASLMLIFLAIAEYTGFIAHYGLEGFMANDFYRDGGYVMGLIFAMVTTLYLVVYMTSSIAVQQRYHERGYREANLQLEEKDRIKNEYVSRVTHDIKAHLSAIKLCLDVLVDGLAGPLDEKQAEFASRAQVRTRKLTEFVQKLLKLTSMRLENKTVKVDFAVAEALNASIATVHAAAEAKNISLSVNSSLGDAEMAGDQLSVEELITGIVMNAVKYTEIGGEILLNAVDSGSVITVEVVDNGIGIPEDSLKHVFDEFFRAENAKKSEKDGTGLGLSIAKQIVEQHGGQISAKNNAVRGTTFTFSLKK